MARYLQDDKEKIIGLGSGLTLKKALQRIDLRQPEYPLRGADQRHERRRAVQLLR
ncbi:hypothetical protein MJ389_18730 [Escherichia coli]|nr:hypothetical protein MJ389_18730 [Escherichia coli]